MSVNVDLVCVTIQRELYHKCILKQWFDTLGLIDNSSAMLSLEKGMSCITLYNFWTIILVRIKVNLQIHYLLAVARSLLSNYQFYQGLILPLVTMQNKFLFHTPLIAIEKGFIILIINPFFYLLCCEDTM